MRISLNSATSKRFARQEKKEEPSPEQEEPPPNHIKAQPFTYLIPFGDYLFFAAILSVSITLSDLYSDQIIRYIINIALRDRKTRFFLVAVVMLAIAFFIRGFYEHRANGMAYAV